MSDTHLPRFGTALPAALLAGLRAAGVARILHCGDHTDERTIALLEAVAPVEAVAGNNDGPELVRRFGRQRIVTLGGTRVGLVHGDLGPGGSTPERARRTFALGSVDVVCFGHSHQPYCARANVAGRTAILLLNPGSPTDKRREPLFSYAILTVGDGEPRAEIVRYASRQA